MNNLLSLERICSDALQRYSSERAIQFEEQWYSWESVRYVASKLGQLIRDSGVGENPVVAFVARNRPSALAAFLGLLRSGCTLRMVYPFQSAEALSNELSSIAPALVVADKSDLSQIVVESIKEYQGVVVALTEMDAEVMTGCERTSRKELGAAKPQIILLTSGTTGPPKQFPLSYETVAEHYTGLANQCSEGAENTSSQPPVLLYFPVSNISGLYTTLPALVNGNPIVLLDRFNLDAWRKFVVRYRPQSFGLPPVGYKMVLDANVPKEELASIETMGAGAAPLDPAIQRAFEERYGVPILLSYGATEFGGPVTAMTKDLWSVWGDRKHGAVGKPLPGMKVRIVNAETGSELPAGHEGILEVISRRIGPEWIRTSDLGVIDSDGFLFLKGRSDGAILRGGFKLVPATIEAALLKNARIAMAAVVGIPDARLGQVPAAAIVMRDGDGSLTAEEVEAELRKLVPATYVPAVWRFVGDLPRTPSMKVDVSKVKQLFME